MTNAPDIQVESGDASGTVPSVQTEQDKLSGTGAGKHRNRSLQYGLAGSLLFHAAIAAFFLMSPSGRSVATKLSGLKANGTSSYGSSQQESPTGATGGKQPNAISVTLTPPPRKPDRKPAPRKPRRDTRKPPPPPARPSSKPAQSEAILTAKGPGPAVAAPVQRRPDPKQPAPKPTRPQTQAAAAPVPVPAPRPRPQRMAKEEPQAANPAPAGSLFGTLGGQNKSPTSGALSGGKKHGAGDAAVSNYPGTIAGKLNASLRYPADARSKGLSGETRVQFVIDASGNVGGVRVLTSSGSDIIDKAAIATVKRATPFPPIPAAAKRTHWPFSVSLAFGE